MNKSNFYSALITSQKQLLSRLKVWFPRPNNSFKQSQSNSTNRRDAEHQRGLKKLDVPSSWNLNKGLDKGWSLSSSYPALNAMLKMLTRLISRIIIQIPLWIYIKYSQHSNGSLSAFTQSDVHNIAWDDYISASAVVPRQVRARERLACKHAYASLSANSWGKYIVDTYSKLLFIIKDFIKHGRPLNLLISWHALHGRGNLGSQVPAAQRRAAFYPIHSIRDRLRRHLDTQVIRINSISWLVGEKKMNLWKL